MGYFCPKINLSKRYVSSAKTLYSEDLTFNNLCENSPNYLCHYIIFLDTTPGAQPKIFQGREGFVKLGHFDNILSKSQEKKAQQGKILEFFFS